MKVLSRSGVLRLTTLIALAIALLGCARNPDASDTPPNSNDKPGFLITQVLRVACDSRNVEEIPRMDSSGAGCTTSELKVQ